MIKALRQKVYQITGSLVIMTAGFPALASPEIDPMEAQMGLPQLDPTTFSSQIFWLIISFVVLYFLMSKLALPRVSDVLERRESDISNNLTRAEALQKEMEDLKTSYEESLAKAHADAQEVMKKIRDQASQTATTRHNDFAENARIRLQDSEQLILKTKNEILQSMDDIAADITRDGLKKVAGITITKDNALKAVQTKIKEAA